MSSGAKVNKPVLVVGALLIVVLVAILASGFGKDPRAVPSVLEQKPAPTFALTDLDGKTWDLAELKGQVVVLNFWSTWCLPCKQEHPLLLQAAKVYPEVRWLGVIYQDTPEKVRPYLVQKGQAFPHLIDPNGRVAIDYGVAGVPETYFVDRQGTIVLKHVGPLSQDVIADTLDPLLEAK